MESIIKRYAVILAGGRGERFWPLSQPDFPKQLLDIFDGKPLLTQALNRIKHYIDSKHRVLIVPEELKRVTRQCSGSENLIIEPDRRNTGPAICLAAMLLQKKHGEGIMHVMPADHLIEPKEKFIQALKTGEKFAARGYLVTYGIKPNRPETGYGYIHIGRRITLNKSQAFLGKKFTEKPDRRKVKKYIKSKKYLWNSGIFTFHSNEILKAFKHHLPNVYKNLCLYTDTNDIKYFKAVNDISLDYGIMEKSKKFCVIAANFKWDDVGSWLALERYYKPDQRSNIIQGDIKALDTCSSIMYTSGVPLRVYGLNDMVVVVSPTGVLVCKKKKAPDLKNLISPSQQRRIK